MRSALIAAFVALAATVPAPSGFGLAAPAAAQEPRGDDDGQSPGQLAGEAMQRLMQALDLLIGAIPQYEAPYVNENGDIIIRRKRGDGLPTPERKPLPPDIDTTTT